MKQAIAVLVLVLGGSMGSAGAEGALKWQISFGDTGAGWPVVDGTNAIIVTTGPEPSQGSSAHDRLFSIRPDGTTNWMLDLPFVRRRIPAVLGDGMIVIPGERAVYAVSRSGSLAWSFPLGGVVDHAASIGSDGSIFVLQQTGRVGSTATRLWRLGRQGQPIWDQDSGVFVAGSPPVIGVDGTVYLSGQFSKAAGRGVVALDPATGRILQQFDASVANPGVSMWVSEHISLFRWGGLIVPDVVLDSSLVWKRRTIAGFGPQLTHPVTITDDDRWFAVFESRLGSSAAMCPGGDVPRQWTFDLGGAGRKGRYATFPVLLANGDLCVIGQQASTLFSISQDGVEKWRVELGGEAESRLAVGLDGTVYLAWNGLLAFEGPTPTTLRTWGQYRADLRRSGRLANPSLKSTVDSVRYRPDGTVAVYVIGVPDIEYSVQASEDLKSWIDVGRGASANGCFELIDLAPTGTASRFYRVAE